MVADPQFFTDPFWCPDCAGMNDDLLEEGWPNKSKPLVTYLNSWLQQELLTLCSTILHALITKPLFEIFTQLNASVAILAPNHL